MTNKLKKRGKVTLALSLLISTFVWSIGLTAFTVNVMAAAPGDLIKQEGSYSVYYLGSDSKRYVFPNKSTFTSWYGSTTAVTTVSSSTLLGYELGGNVINRAGRLVQVVSNDTPWKVTSSSVYALSADGTIQPIDSAATATALFGAGWEARIVPVPEQLFSNYTVGATLTSSSMIPNGFLVTDGSDTFLIDGGKKRAISAEGFTANKYKDSDKVTKSSLSGYTDGVAISGAETALTDLTGNAGSSVVAGSGLTVALASDTPVSANIPVNAPGVQMLKFNVSAASDGPVTINSLTFKKTGLGASTGIDAVWLYEGDSRLTTSKTVNSSSKEVTFTNLGYTVPAGTTKSLNVRATLDTASEYHGFTLVSASSVVLASGTATGTFPIVGSDMYTVTVTDFGGVTIDKAGSNIYTRKIGETQVEIGKFTLTTTNENSKFKGVTLYNTENDILQNVKIYQGATLLGTGVSVNGGKYYDFVFATPDAIEKGEAVTYTIKADIDTDNTNNGAIIYIRYSSDIQIIGDEYGYSLAITANNYDGSSAAKKNEINIEAGAVTFAFNGPATGNISTNTKNVTLLNFNVTAISATKIERDTFTFTSSGAGLSTQMENVELVCDGVVIADYTMTTATTLAVANTSQWEIGAAKTRKCIVRADIKSGATADDTLTVAITTPGTQATWDINDIGTDTDVSSVVPSATITGNAQTLQSATLAVAASTTVSNRTWVKGAKAPAAGFNFTAGDSLDVKVTQVIVSAGLDDTTAGLAMVTSQLSNVEDVVDSIELWDGDTQIGTTEGLTVGSADIKATFDSLAWTVPAGTTKTLVAKVNLSTNAPYNSTNDFIALSIAASDVTAEYGTGTALSTIPASAVNGGATPTYYQTITASGTLALDIPSNTPSTDIAVANASGVSFTKIKLTATNEDFKVSKLALKNAYSATVGDYDDNIKKVYVTYPTNGEATTSETKQCTLASGIVTCTALNIFVPNPTTTGFKSYALVDVTADMQSIVGGADAADAPAFTVSLAGDLEAIGVDSGTVLTEQTTTISDVTGTPVTSVVSINNAGTAYTALTTTLVVDGTSALTALAVGDFIGLTATPSEVMYVSAINSATSITVVRGVNGTTALVATVADNALLFVYGTANTTADLLAVNGMNVQGTKLTVAAGTPAHGGQNATEEVVKFTVTAAAQGDAKIRQGDVNEVTAATTDFATVALAGTFTATDALTFPATGGVGASANHARETSGGTDAASIIYTFGAAADLSAYTGVCYSVRASEAANTITLTLNDDDGTDQTVASGTLVATEWKQVCGDFTAGTGNDNINAISTLIWAVTDASAVSAATYDIDYVILYKEKLNLDLTVNANATAGATTAYLKQNGVTVATGQTVWSANADTANVVFVPVGTYADIEINGTDTFVVELDSTIFTDSTSTENLTATIDLGNSSINGDLYWYDDKGTTNVKYAGVNATDKITNTNKY